MENDKIARYLSSLEREDRYRVDATLKESPHELTQRVFFVEASGAEQGPYVRKFIHRESGMGSAYERIYEAQQAGKRFKHVPLVQECYRHDDFLVVVMEFVAGETLQDFVYRRDPSSQLAADVFPRLCDAVTELHEAFDPPLIHRDLKPSNVMLAGDELTIIDFGIARAFKDGADADTTKFGTRAFAPPEQFGFGQTTMRSDVYALGMLLYYCLTEKIPTSQVRDAQFRGSDVPTRLRPVLVHATALDPDERYASAGELKEAFLEAMAQGEPDAPRRNEPEPRSRKGRIAAVAIALACIVAAIVAIFGLRPADIDDSGETTSQDQSQSETAESDSATTGNETAEQEAAADMQTGAPARNGFDPATNLETTIAGVTFQIPGYFGARTNNADGRMFYYAETGSSTSMIMTSEDPIAASEGTEINSDALEEAKDHVVSGMVQSGRLFAEIISSTDCELAGVPTRIVTFSGSLNDRAITTKTVLLFNAEIEERAVVVGTIAFGQSDNAQFDYSADFAKTVASATPAT